MLEEKLLPRSSESEQTPLLSQIAIPIRTQPTAAAQNPFPYQKDSKLINGNHQWLSHVATFLGPKELSNLASTCRFFRDSRSPLFLNQRLIKKHQIVSLSITLAIDIANSKSEPEGGEYAEVDHALRETLTKRYLARLLDNDPSVFTELKQYYKADYRKWRVIVGLYYLIVIGGMAGMSYGIYSEPDNAQLIVGNAYGIALGLLVLAVCFKCGLHRSLTRNKEKIMIDTIEERFGQLRRTLSSTDTPIFPTDDPMRIELQRMGYLENPAPQQNNPAEAVEPIAQAHL